MQLLSPYVPGDLSFLEIPFLLSHQPLLVGPKYTGIKVLFSPLVRTLEH